MTRRLQVTLVTFALFVCWPLQCTWAAEAGNGKPMWEQSGDVLQWGIPLFGLGLSFLLSADISGDGWGLGAADFATPSLDGAADSLSFNWPGPRLGRSSQRDFLVSFVRMEVATYGLKYAIDARRPNGGSQSFPSGHTAAAFMGAEFIRKEYGLWWGVPAYAAASWVGYTRVQSKNHYWRDVLAGALIGIASNHDFSDIGTGFGKWSVSPTLMSPTEMQWVRPDPLDSLPVGDNVLPVPGVRLEWRF
ncbi:MAG TPA: phosphatase PAP2 family protein [Solimonas sp.]